jgi:hypothetical protein
MGSNWLIGTEPKSALGQKQTCRPEIAERQLDVRFVPKADSCTAAKWVLFDHLVSAKQERFGNPKPDSFGGSEIHD